MKRTLLFFVPLFVSALVLTSCGSQGAKDAAKDQKVVLTMSLYKQEIASSINKLTDAFTQKYPNITINMEIHPNDGGATQAAAAASGKLPDIIQTPAYTQVYDQAKNGYLLDLTSEPVLQKVSKDLYAGVTYQGKVYALPMDIGTLGILYNKEIFKKYNLNAPTTYLELQKVAATLKKNGVIPFAGLLKENWSVGHFLSMVHSSMLGAKVGNAGIASFVADMNEGKADFGKAIDSAELFKLLDWYKANMSPDAAKNAWNEEVAEFATGKAAMVVQGQWFIYPTLQANAKIDLGFIPFPWSNKAEENKFFADADSTFALSAQSPKDRQDAAKLFLEWLSTPEAIKVWTGTFNLISTFTGADMSAMPAAFGEYTASAAAKGTYPWVFQMCPQATWEQAIKNGAQGYLLGKAKPADIIAEINNSWKTNFKK